MLRLASEGSLEINLATLLPSGLSLVPSCLQAPWRSTPARSPTQVQNDSCKESNVNNVLSKLLFNCITNPPALRWEGSERETGCTGVPAAASRLWLSGCQAASSQQRRHLNLLQLCGLPPRWARSTAPPQWPQHWQGGLFQDWGSCPTCKDAFSTGGGLPQPSASLTMKNTLSIAWIHCMPCTTGREQTYLCRIHKGKQRVAKAVQAATV